MIKINVITNKTIWSKFIKTPTVYIDKKVKKLNLKNKKFKKNNIFCTLLLSNDQEIKNLNKKFRKKNVSTDVLSFPFHSKKKLEKKLIEEKEIYLGDIIVNLNKIKIRDNLKNSKLEFDKLWIHGLVHLFGYDHKIKKDFETMLKVEKEYLKYIK
jgi:probable rRNA maturation factor